MRVVILGAGYAGLTLARSLERTVPESVELLVVNDRPHHLIRHELHRTIRKPDFLSRLQLPLDTVTQRAGILVDSVEDINPTTNDVTLSDGEVISYEYAAVCLGATTAFYELPGIATHATPFRDPSHAKAVRNRFLTVLDEGGQVIIGGGGLTGIQVAGELAEIRQDRGGSDRVQITIVEQEPTIAPGFPERFQSAIVDALETLDIEINTNSAITGAEPDRVQTQSNSLPADQFIWTGGIKGPAVFDGRRPQVQATLTLEKNTFVLGDAARVIDKHGREIPAAAQSAIKQARVAATNLTRLIDESDKGGFPPRLSSIAYSPRGWIVSIGDDAVAQVGPSVLRGQPALAVKTSAGVGYLSRIGQVQRIADIIRTEFGEVLS